MKKISLLTGVLLLLVSSQAFAQGAPPPPPAPGGGDPAAAPPPGSPPPEAAPYPGTAPAPYPGTAPAPIPVRIVEPPRPQFKYRLSLNLSLPMAIQFDLGLTRRLGLLVGVGGFSLAGIYWVDAIVGLNIFFKGNAPQGFWLGLKLHNGFIGSDNENAAYIFQGKLMFGYNWIWRSGFSFGLGLGAQYLYAAIGEDFFLEGAFVAWDITIGWGF